MIYTSPDSVSRIKSSTSVDSSRSADESVSDIFSAGESASDIFSARLSISTGTSEASIPSYFESTSKCPQYSAPHDALPGYAPTLELFGMSVMKLEFVTPYKSTSKPWEPVLIELNLTQLIIHRIGCSREVLALLVDLFQHVNGDQKLQKSKVLAKHHHTIEENQMLFEPVTSRSRFNEVMGKYNCTVAYRLTLSGSKAGIAPNAIEDPFEEPLTTIPYKNTLRLRIEMHQMLLQFWSFGALVRWFTDMSIGKDLSGSLRNDGYGSKTLPGHSVFRMLQDQDDEDYETRNEITIKHYTLYKNDQYGPRESRFIYACLPKLNSYDKWNCLVLSDYDRFPISDIDDNIFVSFNKLSSGKATKVSARPGVSKCRTFAIELEGLVSIKGC